MAAAVDSLNDFMVQSPFNAWLGCRIQRLNDSPGELEVYLPRRSELQRGDSPVAHGGVIAALIDVAAHASLHAITGSGMPTIDLKIDYLQLATLPLTAIAQPRRAGRTIGFVDVEVFDANMQLAAIGRAVLLTLQRSQPSPPSR